MKQPFCRYCGAKIRKRTTTIYFVAELKDYHVRENAAEHGFVRHVVGHPTTKAEAQKLVNQEIVSVRHTSDPWAHNPGDVYIAQASAWDGESYVDEFFCNGAHAKDFAYAAARGGYAMPAYIDREREKA